MITLYNISIQGHISNRHHGLEVAGYTWVLIKRGLLSGVLVPSSRWYRLDTHENSKVRTRGKWNGRSMRHSTSINEALFQAMRAQHWTKQMETLPYWSRTGHGGPKENPENALARGRRQGIIMSGVAGPSGSKRSERQQQVKLLRCRGEVAQTSRQNLLHRPSDRVGLRAGMLAEPWCFSSLVLFCYYHKTLLLLITHVNESLWLFCMFLCGDFIDSTLPTCPFCPSHSFLPPLLA